MLTARTHGPPPAIRPALPRGPFPGPDPRRCLTDDLSCRQSIGSSSRGARRTKRALWRGRPLGRRVRRRDPLRNSERRPPADSRVMSSRPCGSLQSPRASLASPGGLPGPPRAPPPSTPPGGGIGGRPQREVAVAANLSLRRESGAASSGWLWPRGRCRHLINFLSNPWSSQMGWK